MSLKVKDILEILDKYCSFPKVTPNSKSRRDDLLSEETIEEYIIEPLQSCGKLNNWDYRYGVTKLCLLFSELPYIIKIPLQTDGDGYYETTSRQAIKFSRMNKTHFDKNDLTWIHESIYRFDTYYGPGQKSKEIEREWDYCELESLYTKRARKEKLDKYFAKTILVGYVQDYPIYVQQKCTPYEEENNSNHTHTWVAEKTSKANELMRENGIDYKLSPYWAADFIELYGEKEFQKFSNFMKENHINDLHNGNVGYFKGKPVLFDYSGFDS